MSLTRCSRSGNKHSTTFRESRQQAAPVVLRDPQGKGPNLSLNRVLRETFRQAKQTAPRPVHNNREAEVEPLTSVGATPAIPGGINRAATSLFCKIPAAIFSAWSRKPTATEPRQGGGKTRATVYT